MLKIALAITIVSISNPEKPPEITIPVFYSSLEECNNQLDFLKAEVNAIEIKDKENNRILRLENREYHHRNYIFWSCLKTIVK